MTFKQSDIGPIYDVGIATRPYLDNSTRTLPVKNRDGKTVNLSQVAYMVDISQEQQEATDLQRKDQLVRLSTGNIIDRELTNYPQASQGNFSGGVGQRVLADTTKSWDGEGIIWPLDAIIPTIPVQTAVFLDPAGTGSASAWPGLAAGDIDIGYANAPPAKFTLLEAFADNVPTGKIVSTQYDGTRHVDTNASLPSNFNTTPFDLVLANGRYYWYYMAGNTITLAIGATGSSSNLTGGGQLTSAVTAANLGPATWPKLFTGTIGHFVYLAVAYWSTATTFLSIAVHDISLRDSVSSMTQFTFPVQALMVTDIIFANEVMYVASKAGAEIIIYSVNIGSSAYTVVARLPGYDDVTMCVVGGQIVVIASAIGFASSLIDIYTLVGTQLTYQRTIENLQAGPAIAARKATKPIAFYDYAIFGVVDQEGSVAFGGKVTETIYAYNIITNSLFVVKRSYPDVSGGLIYARRQFVLMPGHANPLGPTASHPYAYWGLAAWLGPASYQLNEFGLMQVPAAGSGGVLSFPKPQLSAGGNVTSSIIDFSSSASKLFGAIIVEHEPIPAGDGGAGIAIDAWLDQEPDNLVTDVGLIVNFTVGSTKTVLNINKIARKLVYKVSWACSGILGGGSVSPAAPRPISVKVRASTGWVNTLRLALTADARTNNQAVQETCFKNQSDVTAEIDEVAAYNFLRQVWRLQQGECILTLANGDQYNAVFEEETMMSPKPFSGSFVSDRPGTYSAWAQVKIREDI